MFALETTHTTFEDIWHGSVVYITAVSVDTWRMWNSGVHGKAGTGAPGGTGTHRG